VKWLARLRFDTAEAPNFYHATDYRAPLSRFKPGEKFRFTLENSRLTRDTRLMSYILQPEPGAKLKTGPSLRAESLTTTVRRHWSQRSCRWTAGNRRRGRTQPLDGSIFWNPNGYEWTRVYKLEVTVQWRSPYYAALVKAIQRLRAEATKGV
jgi:sulfite oxidase